MIAEQLIDELVEAKKAGLGRTLAGGPTADKDQKKILRSIKFPGGKPDWSKRGGYAGQKTIKKVVDAAKAAGWKEKKSTPTASASGSMMGHDTVYVDDQGNELGIDQSYGVTKADNRYSMRVKFAKKNEVLGAMASGAAAAVGGAIAKKVMGKK